jgi:hypothetical protein
MTDNDDVHRGHIEISSKMKEGGMPLTPFDIQVKLDGKVLPFLQRIELDIDVDNMPVIRLTMLPKELIIDLKDIEVDMLEREPK